MKIKIKSTAEFIERANVVHNNWYDYSLAEYTGSDKKLIIICPEHGQFSQLANRHLSGTRCKKCSFIAAKQTCILRYGVDSSFKSKEIQQKIKATNIARYGVEFASQSEQIKTAKRETCIAKFGANSPLEAESVKNTIKQRHVDKRGVDHHWKSKQVREQITTTMLDRYGVKFASQNTEIQDKVNSTNLERYGVRRPIQSEVIREGLKQTNVERYGTQWPQQAHLDSETLRLMNDVEYLTHQHHVNKLTIGKISEILGVDPTGISAKFDIHNIEKLRFAGSQGERDIIDWLTTYDITLVPNNRQIIPPFELDLYLPDYNLAIEYGGLYWHSDQFKSKKYHQEKYQRCSEQGIRLLTIFEDEWLTNTDLVKQKILHILNLSTQPKVFARKCKISIVDSKSKKIFYNQNHIQGNGPGSLTYGLYYDNTLVSCMTFIVKQNGVYELNRYATSCNVVGGFSKLLSYFKDNNEYSKIISFADLRWSAGDMYDKNGFVLDGVVPPTYEYIVNNHRIHRSNFMRYQLPKRLGDQFDPSLTEFQNCDQAGVFRIWNCGLLRYIIQK